MILFPISGIRKEEGFDLILVIYQDSNHQKETGGEEGHQESVPEKHMKLTSSHLLIKMEVESGPRCGKWGLEMEGGRRTLLSFASPAPSSCLTH